MTSTPVADLVARYKAITAQAPQPAGWCNLIKPDTYWKLYHRGRHVKAKQIAKYWRKQPGYARIDWG